MVVKLIHIMTVPDFLTFLKGRAQHLRKHAIKMQVITSPGTKLNDFAAEEGVESAAINIARRITPLKDIVSLFRLTRELYRQKPTIVHAHTPKGALLGMLAAFFVRTPVRIYQISGLVLVTATGPKRFLLYITEWITCYLAHAILCVSHSLRDVVIQEGLCSPDKISVLLSGSISGIDALKKFNPSKYPTAREKLRTELGIPKDAFLVGFVGRLVREKGIAELAQAFQQLRDQIPTLHLLLVGPFEHQDPVDPKVRQQLANDPRVHEVGFQSHTPPYFAAIDLLVLPSWREGFGVVLLEAAAMALPVVATEIPGCIDAVVDKVTGTLVPPRSPQALAAAIQTYAANPTLCQSHGEAGRTRVLQDFQQEKMWEANLAFYNQLSPSNAAQRSKAT